MKAITFILNLGACLCVLYILYRFYLLKRLMYSKAWTIINISFIVLLCKWIFDAYLVYTIDIEITYSSIIHEIFTFVFALLAAIGFSIFCNDFSLAKRLRFSGYESSDTLKKFTETTSESYKFRDK